MINFKLNNLQYVNNSNGQPVANSNYSLRLQSALYADTVSFKSGLKTPNQVVNDAMLQHYPYILGTDAVSKYLTSRGCSKDVVSVAVKKLRQQMTDLNTNVLDDAGVKFSKEEADVAILYFDTITRVKKQMNEIATRKLLSVYDRFLTKNPEQITQQDTEFATKAFSLLREVTGVDENGNNSLSESKFEELKAMGIDFSKEEKIIISDYKKTYDTLLKQNPLIKQYEVKAGMAQQARAKKMAESGQYPNDYFEQVLVNAIQNN